MIIKLNKILNHQTEQSIKSSNTTKSIKSAKSNESAKIVVKGRNTKNIKKVELDGKMDELEKALSN